MELAKRVRAKHHADGEASLLKILDWEEATTAIDEALINHEKAERMRREMREAYQQRDLRLRTIADTMRNSRDILSGVYKKQMKVLGQWGYEVLDVRSQPTSSDHSNGWNWELKRANGSFFIEMRIYF